MKISSNLRAVKYENWKRKLTPVQLCQAYMVFHQGCFRAGKYKEFLPERIDDARTQWAAHVRRLAEDTLDGENQKHYERMLNCRPAVCRCKPLIYTCGNVKICPFCRARAASGFLADLEDCLLYYPKGRILSTTVSVTTAYNLAVGFPLYLDRIKKARKFVRKTLKPDFGQTNWLVLPKVYGSMLRLNFLCFWRDPAQAADVMKKFPPNYKLNIRGNGFQTFYYPGYPILRSTFRLAKMVSWAVSYPRSMRGIDVADIETQRAYFELHRGKKLFTHFGTIGEDNFGEDTDYNLSA